MLAAMPSLLHRCEIGESAEPLPLFAVYAQFLAGFGYSAIMIGKCIADFVKMHNKSRGISEFWPHCIDELRVPFDALGLCILFHCSRSVADNQIDLADCY